MEKNPDSKRGKFTTELHVRWLTNTLLQVTKPLKYWCKDGCVYTVPAGTTTDLASVPPIFRSFLALMGAGWSQTAKAGVLHDYFYQHGPELGVSRREADKIMRRALRAENVGRVPSWIMWAAVRVDGMSAWNKWREIFNA